MSLGQLCCATRFDVGDVVFQIVFTDSLMGAITVDVLAAASDPLFNDLDDGGPSNLATHLADWATTAEAAAGTDGTWDAQARPGGTAGQLEIKRTPADSGDVVDVLVFGHADLPPSFLGLVDEGGGEVSPSEQDSEAAFWRGGWAGGLWRPPDPWVDAPLSGEGGMVSVGAVGVAASPFAGHATALDFGAVDGGEIIYELLYGIYVFRRHFTAAFLGFVTDVEAGDMNAALEPLQIWHRSHGPLRWWPDRSDLATFVNVEVADEGWLSDLTSTTERQNNNPALYRVEIPVRRWEGE